MGKIGHKNSFGAECTNYSYLQVEIDSSIGPV